MTAVWLITEMSWHEPRIESLVSSGVARECVESCKASKLNGTGMVLTGCEGWRQKHLMKSHRCSLSEESLE